MLKLVRPKTQHYGWLLVTVFALLYHGPRFVQSIYPGKTPHMVSDFYQDWNSARNFRNGLPIYASIDLTMERYLGYLPRDWLAGNWRVNAHPPASVLLAYPFAWLEYRDAFLIWTIISLGALAISLWLIVRHLEIRVSGWSVFPAVAILLLCYPFRNQIIQGQFNLVLLLLVTLVWVAARSGYSRWAGAVLGTATAVKLFPGLIFIYFVLRRDWKVLMFGAATLAAVTAVSAATLPAGTFHDYLVEVLPTLSQWQSHPSNISLVGFWSKLFDPVSAGTSITILPLFRSPRLARIGALLSCASLLAAVLPVILRARTRSDCDQAFGLVVTGMILVSPIAWDHYLLLLVVPLSIAWVHFARSGSVRWIWMLMAITLFPPPGLIWKHLIPGTWPYVTATPLYVLTALSFQFYALLGLFTIQWMQANANETTLASGAHFRVNDVSGEVNLRPSGYGSSDRGKHG